MTAYQVQRSITIQSTITDINTLLKDYKQWHHWSPWLIMEPDATLMYSTNQGQVGASYAWSGLLVGSGRIELIEVQEKTLLMKIHFVKPFKFNASVCFDLEALKDGVKVTWSMSGKLPWFMLWMRKLMIASIGMDYERGLAMLKEYAQSQKVSSYVIAEGLVSIEKQQYIGIPRSCTIEELPDTMQKDFQKLEQLCTEHNLSLPGVPFSIYHSFDIVKRQTEFISCIPMDHTMNINLDSIEGAIKGTVESQKALKIIHKGAYQHLGNGWMTGMTLARMQKMKMKKRPVGYEFYLNHPAEVSPEALVTEIYMPLRH